MLDDGNEHVKTEGGIERADGTAAWRELVPDDKGATGRCVLVSTGGAEGTRGPTVPPMNTSRSDTAAFLTGTPAVRDFRLTNQAVLGALMDDHSVPLAFLRSSVGFFDGGPVVDKSFPVANGGASRPGLFGGEYKAIPDRPGGPLYTWRNDDRVGDPDDPGYRSADGTPFTDAGKEVTDIQELARSLAEQPLDFIEQYFPTKLVTDLQLSGSPQVERLIVHPDGLTADPTLTVLAGDGLLAGRVPADLDPVIAPGYQHLDVLTVAPVQNDGRRPEPVSTSLAAFAREPNYASPAWEEGPGGSSSRALCPVTGRYGPYGRPSGPDAGNRAGGGLRPCPRRRRPPRRRCSGSSGVRPRHRRRSRRSGRRRRRSRWCGSGRRR